MNIRTQRIEAVDAARCVALVGMFTTHILGDYDEQLRPNLAQMVTSGRSAAIFAVLAGVSLVLATRNTDWTNRLARRQANASIAVRALIIAIIGLLLAYPNRNAELGVYIILPYYALAFFLVAPLLRRTTAAGITALFGALAMGPLVVLFFNALTAGASQPNFTLLEAIANPLGLLVELMFTGAYPIACYVAYVIAGILLGRLALGSFATQVKLLIAGAVLAVGAFATSTFVLFQLGGIDKILRDTNIAGDQTSARNAVLWVGDIDLISLWSLADRAPHSNSALEMLHNIGVAMFVLGLLGLILRSSVVRRGAYPLIAAGSMPLTAYTLHVSTISVDALYASPGWLFVGSVVAIVLFASIWKHFYDRGPLEALTASAVSFVRSSMARRHARPILGPD